MLILHDVSTVDVIGDSHLVCITLGIPLASDKTVAPTTGLTFLWIGIDAVKLTRLLDEDKRVDAIDKLTRFMAGRSQQRPQWQSLVGTLSFLFQVVFPCRAHMSRISGNLKSTQYWIYTDNYTRDDVVLGCIHQRECVQTLPCV